MGDKHSNVWKQSLLDTPKFSWQWPGSWADECPAVCCIAAVIAVISNYRDLEILILIFTKPSKLMNPDGTLRPLPRRRAPAEVASDECNCSSVRTIQWNEIPKLPSLPLNYCLTDYFSVKNIFLTRWPSEGSKNKCWMEQREKPGVTADVTAFIWW